MRLCKFRPYIRDALYLVVAVAAAPAGGPGLCRVVRGWVLVEGRGGEGRLLLLLRLLPGQTPHLCRNRRLNLNRQVESTLFWEIKGNPRKP